MTSGRSLYEQDFVRWTDEQAAAIRAAAASGANLPLDWENLAEEVESLGRSLRAELRHRLGTVIEHLLKLEVSHAIEPRRGWAETVRRERVEIEALLDENPSLRATLADSLALADRKARQLAEISLDRHGELSPQTRRALGDAKFQVQEVIGPWLPENAGRH